MFNFWRDLAALGIAGFRKGNGCQHCGYYGPNGRLGEMYTFKGGCLNRTANPTLSHSPPHILPKKRVFAVRSHQQ